VKSKRKAMVANALPPRAPRTPSLRPSRPAISLGQPKLRVPQPRGLSPEPGLAFAEYELQSSREVSLAVDLGRDLVLASPLLAAAGPFGYGAEAADLVDLDRLGAIVTRGTTLKPRAGHPGPRIAEVTAGLLIGVGLQNPGIDAVLERYGAAWSSWPLPVIVNLCADTAGELGEAVRRLEGAPGVAGVEINLSCGIAKGGAVPGLDPDSTTSWIAAARRATDLPVIAKLTAAAADIWSIAQAAEDAGADVISAINTLPGFLPSRDGQGPALGSDYGGLCGPALKAIALRAVWEIAQSVEIPVIGIGGVTVLDDVLDMLAVGASAVGVGVAAMADPMLPVRLADELADACRARGVASVRDLVGTALPKKRSAPSTRGAEYAR
jgi:dihydroorotate dehydrogenase (NAD+) catalytic subunit